MYYIIYKHGPVVSEDPYEGAIAYKEFPYDHLIESLELDIVFFKDTLESTANLVKYSILKDRESKIDRISILKDAIRRLKKGEKVLNIFD